MERWSTGVRRLALGRWGPSVLFCWAFLEAISFPLIPDSGLMAFAFAAPVALWRLWAACGLGSVAGGLTGMGLSRLGAVWPLPLVTDRMKSAVDGWLAEGASGLLHQPLSGVPYKAFVLDAGGREIAFHDWAYWTALTRGSRMLVFGLIGAAAGLVLWRVVAEPWRVRVHFWTTVVGAALLLSGLLAVVVAWS